jgi:hypothetical protein
MMTRPPAISLPVLSSVSMTPAGDIDSLKASFAEVEQQFAMQATFYDSAHR